MSHDDVGIEFEIEQRDEPHPRSRRRLVAGLGAAMLVAAAGGVGFGIGRSIDDGDGAIAPTEPSVESDQPATTEPVDEPVDEPADEPAEEPADEPIDVAAAETDAASFPASGGAGWTAFGETDMALLAERTTESGVTIRAHLGETWDHGYDVAPGFDGWQPPGWCFESGQVRIALGGGTATGVEIIDTGAVSWWNEPFKGRAVSWLTLGRVDGNPHRVLFAQAPAGTTSVTATFGDGETDTVVPQNGVALLVVPGPPETVVHEEADYRWIEELPDFDVQFAGAEPITIDDAQVGSWSDPEFQASCSPPPPALPEPGEQPVDAAAAEIEIVELMATIYGENETDQIFDSIDFIDDPTGVAEAREMVSEGSFEEAAAAAEAIVEELVFTTPTDAWFRYRIETTTGTFGDRFGQATSIDGTWKITRATICQDLSLAGGSCDPWVDSIVPTGS